LNLGALGVALASALDAQYRVGEMPVTLVTGALTFVGIRVLLGLVFLLHA
jgi:hypothetical protein